MIGLRGITVCRTQPGDKATMPGGMSYDDLLTITLPRNLRHLAECVVVTSPEDERTRAVVEAVPDARVFITDAFTRHGARFNKGLAMEEGFDALGREGWILIWDADILLPDVLPLDGLTPDALHGARRRMLDDPSQWHEGLEWGALPTAHDGAPIGFFQLFRADAPGLRGKRPWYDVSFAHAGGSDAYFLGHFGGRLKRMLPIEVLHLGPRDTNWFGTDPAGQDTMSAFVHRNGWTRARPGADPTAVERVGEITERVTVPGYAPSGFELPFVRRAKKRNQSR